MYEIFLKFLVFNLLIFYYFFKDTCTMGTSHDKIWPPWTFNWMPLYHSITYLDPTAAYHDHEPKESSVRSVKFRKVMFSKSTTYFFIQNQDHVRKAGKLEQNEEDELAGKVLPKLVNALRSSFCQVFLLRPFHRNHNQVDQLFLQDGTSQLHLIKQPHRRISVSAELKQISINQSQRPSAMFATDLMHQK